MSELNGNGPRNYGEATVEWIDGFRTGYTEAYPQGYEDGIVTGHTQGYDEATERFRVLLKDHYDSDLNEAFERLIG